MPRRRWQSKIALVDADCDGVAEIQGPHLLTPRLILRWSLLFRRKEGKWPGGESVVWDRTRSGNWVRVRGESWTSITKALQSGRRGLAALRGKTVGELRRLHGLDPQLGKDQVVVWITNFRQQEGRWSNHTDECVWEHHERRGWVQKTSSTWLGVSVTLSCGLKDCDPMSLNQFQHRYGTRPSRPPPRRRSQPKRRPRGQRRPRSTHSIRRKPPLTEGQLIEWIKAFHQKTGRYPLITDKTIWRETRQRWARVPSESWNGINHALRTGQRGLYVLGPLTLLKFRMRHGLTRNTTEAQLVTWITYFREKEGRYPTIEDPDVWAKTADGKWRKVLGETWHGWSASLTRGARGLDEWKGSSLSQFCRSHGLHRDLTELRIVGWIEAFHDKESRWPTQNDKMVWERNGRRWARVARETWTGINLALMRGTRGLEELQGESLWSIRQQHGFVDSPLEVTDEEVVSWAREYQRRRERWPNFRDTVVWVTPSPGQWIRNKALTWRRIDDSLRKRPGAQSTTLARLKKKYGMLERVQFTAAGIERWIRFYREKEQHWPKWESTVVWDRDEHSKVWCTVGEVTWSDIDGALVRGTRGLQALRGSSLEKFRYQHGLAEPLSVERVLGWVRGFRLKEQRYPRRSDTRVWEQSAHHRWCIVAGWSWVAIDSALAHGYLDSEGSSSLTELCESHGLVDEVRSVREERRLTADKIRQWLLAFKAKEGRWPLRKDRTVWEEQETKVFVCVAGESWAALAEAMVLGLRGLTELKGTRLSQFRVQHGLVDDRTLKPETLEQWMKQFHQKMERWPTEEDRTVWEQDTETQEWIEVAGESWGALTSTLRHGRRGLKAYKGRTLAQFRVERGLVEDRTLTVEQIVSWMKTFRAKEDRWPAQYDSTVWENPRRDVWVPVANENWQRLDDALARGLRGLKDHKGSSLAKIKNQYNLRDTIRFTPRLIKRWIRLYFRKEGCWPTASSPVIWQYELREDWEVVEGESWRKIDQALIFGTRGLKELKGSSLYKFRIANGLEGDGEPSRVDQAA